MLVKLFRKANEETKLKILTQIKPDKRQNQKTSRKKQKNNGQE